MAWNTLSPEICGVILSKTSRHHAKMCVVSSRLLGAVVQSAEPITFDVAPFSRQRLVASGYHSLAVTADGSLFSWGSGFYGRLGLGGEYSRYVPTLVQGELKSKPVTQVSAAYNHCACVTCEGTVFTWGTMLLGDDAVLLPRLVGGLLQGKAVAQVAAGNKFIICITIQGAVFSWGDGQKGALGLGDRHSRQLPTQVQGSFLQGKRATQVSAGGGFALCATTDGAVFSWGDGQKGALGLKDTNTRLVPTLIEGLQGNSVAQVATGSYHGLAVTVDGAMFSWGFNSHSQLGLGDTDNRLLPTLVQGGLQGEAVAQVSAGFRTTACVTESGAAFAWGGVSFM